MTNQAENARMRMLDVQDVLGEAKNLNEAVFMAATDIRDRDKMSAIQAVSDIIDKRLRDAIEMLVAPARRLTTPSA